MTTNTQEEKEEEEDTKQKEESRPMNDSTMPPPPRQKVAPRSSPQSNNGRRFGLADWTRLLASSRDLAQRRGQPLRRDIAWSEIQQHNTIHDGWMVLKHNVYRLSPYLPYHPGGAAILKAVLGKDATALFEKYHRWVNEDGLIGALLIGYVDPRRRLDDEDDDDEATPPAIPLPAAIRPKEGDAS